ncbi:MAG TPA: tetratricopeptide repeat protein [Candidatus Hydrogenedentes bacterium]|nr:tetratricopeptide repeat protein [Candidatus Hydrogenedentota bacterium]
MPKGPIKNNPAFLAEEGLVKSFVVRQGDLKLISGILRENTGAVNQHVLVIGPRGMGKTMFVLRMAAEVRRDETLSRGWYPLALAEESYTVTTPGELWLEAVFHLGRQTGDTQWVRVYEELLLEKDEVRLQSRALGYLLDFADKAGKRILLIVENLNMLLGEQLRERDTWTLRQTLLNELRIMLLATTTMRFAHVEKRDKAFFDVFKVHELKPLNGAECSAVWKAVTGESPGNQRIRPIQILTGGSPRLLTIVASFAADLSFRQLMDDLLQLVDDHTEYFKSYFDSLAAKERKVYVTLAELWEPVSARTVAGAARMSVNEVSALLNRLMERGAVTEAAKRGRTKYYQSAERMYNIYYLMRRRGVVSNRVRYMAAFMVSFYGESELPEIALRIAEEACRLVAKAGKERFTPFEAILRKSPGMGWLGGINAPEAPETALVEAVEEDKKHARWLKRRTAVLEMLLSATKRDVRRAKELLEADLAAGPEDAGAWYWLGMLLQYDLCQYHEAENAFREALRLQPENPENWYELGRVLERNRTTLTEAESAYRKALELDGAHCQSWLGRVSISLACGEEAEALALAEKALKKSGRTTELLCSLAVKFIERGKRTWAHQAEAWAREGIAEAPESLSQYPKMALVLCACGCGREALPYARSFLRSIVLPETWGRVVSQVFCALAAAGLCREAIALLNESQGKVTFEPLLVALRMYLGEDVLAPVEILEISKDLVKNIEAWKPLCHPGGK